VTSTRVRFCTAHEQASALPKRALARKLQHQGVSVQNRTGFAKNMTRTPSIEVDILRHRVIVGGAARGKRGTGPGEFHYPAAVKVVQGRAYVVDSWNHRVQVFDLPEWTFAFEFGDFFCPKWIDVVTDQGTPLLVVVDTNNGRLCFQDLAGRRVAVFEFHSRIFPVAARVLDSEEIEVVFEDGSVGKFGIAELLHPRWWTTKLQRPISIVRDGAGFVYVSDFGRRTVEKFNADGEFIAELLGPDVLTLPGKMSMNGTDLLITDRPANAIWIVDTVTNSHRRWEYEFVAPGVIGRDSNGVLWVAPYRLEPDPKGALFLVFDANYGFLRTVEFHESHQPTSIAFAGDRAFVADQEARAVLMYGMDGTFIGPLRSSAYDWPVWAVMHDGNRHLYVGAGPVVDVLWTPDLARLYYIDFEASAVRYSEEETTEEIAANYTNCAN
jgi:hypothetical protein